MIHFTCGSCQRQIQVAETAAGKRAKCPACGAIIQIPTPGMPQSAAPPPLPVPVPIAVAETMPADAPQPTPLPTASPAMALPGATHVPHVRDAREGVPAIDHLIDALARALSVWKLGLFLVGGLLLWGILWCLSKMAPSRDPGIVVMLLWIVLNVVVAIGFLGVLAGAVARLTHRERQVPGGAGLTETLLFCARRSLDFAAGAVIVALGAGLLCYVVNYLIVQLRTQGKFGDLLTSLLFLPQLAINILVVFLLLVGVLMPSCAIAVEDIGAVQALGRLFNTFRKRTGALLVQVGVMYFLGGVITAILGLLLLGGLIPTMATNAPAEMPKVASKATAGFFRWIFWSQPWVGKAFALASGRAADPWASGRDADEDIGADPWASGRDPDEDILEDFSRGLRPSPKAPIDPGRFFYDNRGPGREQSKPGPQWPRWLPLVLCYALVVTYPLVFWVCSFTRFYESILPAVSEPQTIHPGGSASV